MSAIYIFGVYHKHTICFIGHENYAIIPFIAPRNKCFYSCEHIEVFVQQDSKYASSLSEI